jgi:hypothetical protein
MRADGKWGRFSAGVMSALLFCIQLVWALGTTVAATACLALSNAGNFGSSGVLGIGFSPTSMTSANAPQAALTVHYDKQFFKNLKADLVFLLLCTMREMPTQAGQAFRAFMYNTLGPNTVQQTEGTVGTGISITVNFVNYIMGQWADFINFSDFLIDTTIDPMLENVEREMAYRFAQSIQALVRAQFDYLRTLDAKTATYDAVTNPYYFTKAQLEQNAASLQIQNVKMGPGGKPVFHGVLPPNFWGDLMIDNTNNSIVDIMKHTPEGLARLTELPEVDGQEVRMIDLCGTYWMTSTQVTQYPNWQGSGLTGLSSYLAGEDAVIAVKMDRPDRSSLGDGKSNSVKISRVNYTQPSKADPAGVIKASTSYNWIGSFGPAPDPTSRARVWVAVPQTT